MSTFTGDTDLIGLIVLLVAIGIVFAMPRRNRSPQSKHAARPHSATRIA
jgi:hypothetical protein